MLKKNVMIWSCGWVNKLLNIIAFYTNLALANLCNALPKLCFEGRYDIHS